MGNNGGIRASECRLQLSHGSFRIGLDSALQFVFVDGGWSFTALIFLEARISCREAIESAVDCPTGSSALTECIVDVRGRSARVVVLAPLVVDDCSKLGFTDHCRQVVNTPHADPLYTHVAITSKTSTRFSFLTGHSTHF